MAFSTTVSRALPDPLKLWLKQARAGYIRTFRSFTAADLRAALGDVGLNPGDLVMLHSSFGQFAGFRGTPMDVIHVFQDLLGPSGTLLVPTMPFSDSMAEYVRGDMVFDARRTASRMGLLTEVFRRSAGVVRSLHPTHAVAGWGRLAEAITADHHRSPTPCGPATPYGRLLELDGKILFAGVPASTMTFFHSVEEGLESRLPFPVFEPERRPLRYRTPAGDIQSVEQRIMAESLAQHRTVEPLLAELRRRGHWRERSLRGLDLILLRAREVMTAASELAEQGIYCFVPESH